MVKVVDLAFCNIKQIFIRDVHAKFGTKDYFRKKAATCFKTRLSLNENAKGLLTRRRRENAAGDLGGGSSCNIKLSIITKLK